MAQEATEQVVETVKERGSEEGRPLRGASTRGPATSSPTTFGVSSVDC